MMQPFSGNAMTTILLVEPQGVEPSELLKVLQQPDWEVIVANTRQELLQKLAERLPQLVVLDLTVENGRGVELCHLIRETPGADLLPVLLVGTGSEGVHDFGDALVEGGDYYFQKPPDASLLLAKIRTYTGSAPPAVAPASAQQAPAAPAKKLDERVEQLMELGASFRQSRLKVQQEGEAVPPPPAAASEPIPPPPVVFPPPASARKPATAPSATPDLETIMSQLAEELALLPESPPGQASAIALEQSPAGPQATATSVATSYSVDHAAQALSLRLRAEELLRREVDRRLCGELIRQPTLQPRSEERAPTPAAVAPAETPSTTSNESEELEAEKFWSEAEAAESPIYQPVPTRTNTSRLLQLLQHEAVMARQKALAASEGEEEETEPTRPNLPPRPEEKTAQVVRLNELRAAPPKYSAENEHPTPPAEEAEADSVVPKAATPGEENAGAEEELPSVFVEPPRPLFRPPQPQEAQLRGESTSELFWRFFRQKITGAVLFTNAGTQKTVFFENGLPVGMQSNLIFDRLEEFLLRESLIDKQIYAEARIKALSARSLAAYLVERGLLSAEEFFPVLRRHFLESLLSLFEWQEGNCSFAEAYAPEGEKLQLGRGPAWLVMEGIRRKYSPERLLHELGGPATLAAPVPVESWPVKPGEVGLLPEERQALSLVNGSRTLEEIVFQSGQNEEVVYRTLLGASILGLVVITARGLAGEKEEQVRNRLQALRRRLEHKFAQLDKVSYFELLGVSPQANTYEIEQAYRRLRREFHPAAYSHPQLADVAPRLQALIAALEEAHDVLRDELLRESYRASLKAR